MEKKSERESCGSETQIVEEQTKPSFVQVNKGELNELKTTYCKYEEKILSFLDDLGLFFRMS